MGMLKNVYVAAGAWVNDATGLSAVTVSDGCYLDITIYHLALDPWSALLASYHDTWWLPSQQAILCHFIRSPQNPSAVELIGSGPPCRHSKQSRLHSNNRKLHYELPHDLTGHCTISCTISKLSQNLVIYWKSEELLPASCCRGNTCICLVAESLARQ